MRVLKWIDEHLEEWIMIFLLVLISSTMLLQVIMRYVLNNSLSWPEEFGRYCYVWTTFLSLGLTARYGNMLRVTVVMDFVPNLLRSIITIITQLIVVIFFAVFFYNSFGVVSSIKLMGQTSTAMGWPMYAVYYSTIIGFGLGMIRSFQVLYYEIKNFGKKRETTIEAIKKEAKSEAQIISLD